MKASHLGEILITIIFTDKARKTNLLLDKRIMIMLTIFERSQYHISLNKHLGSY